MKNLCADCNVCEFMPEQKLPRVLAVEPECPTSVLVIDAPVSPKEMSYSREVAAVLLDPVECFTYTNYIRCHFSKGELSIENWDTAASRCAVWTNMLLEGRNVVLAHTSSLVHLGLSIREPGAIFRTERYGVVVVIPPLVYMDDKDIDAYHKKVQRALREAGLVK